MKEIINKKFWIGFKNIECKTEFKCLSNPRVNGFGWGELIAKAGVSNYYYEYLVFVDNKPFFRYESKNKYQFEVNKKWGYCHIKIKNK